MHIPQRVALQSPIRQLRVEYSSNEAWIIWLTANGDWSLGTYISLNNDGTIQRITLHEDGTESVFDLKE
jgi:hypothetical protein|tara:strand:- start:16114 stop:16320 length:207 start_codon:yes stop_codon:yes gene_type:complete